MFEPRFLLSTLILCALVAPQFARASVVISEIAWMGSVGNANAEWIELHNTADTEVALAGWTLSSLGAAPQIPLKGAIAPGSYFLLERSSDASVPGITAGQVYTGALANGGDTLSLKDGSGVVVDQVVGGKDWKDIGGDNTSKKTPQKTPTGWVTAAPTPGVVNATAADEEVPVPETPVATTTPVVTVGGTAPASGLPTGSPVRVLEIDAGNDRLVPAHVPTPFRAFVYTKGGNARSQAEVKWNFGDGVRVHGKDVVHTYDTPGTYAVTVRAHDDVSTSLRILKVVVEETTIGIATSSAGIELTNTTGRMVDLSGWRIDAGGTYYRIPDDTVLWPGSVVTFSPRVTGLPDAGRITLRYPDGALASRIDEAQLPGIPLGI